MRRIDELHMDFPFAGSPMLRDLLGAEGIKVGRLHVATLMKSNCSGGWLAATCSGDREVAVNEVANGAEGGLSGEARGAGDGAIPGVDLSPPF